MRSLLLLFTFVSLNATTGCTPKKDYIVKIKTSLGDMIAILYDETPKHKENFIKLAKEGYYDSLLFHRVMAGFMIQGGDPDSKQAKSGQPLGTGGPGYTIEAEIRPNLFHEKGALCAARLGDAQNPSKASSGSQFYLVQGTVMSKEDTMQLKIDQAKFGTALNTFLQKEENKSLSDALQKTYTSGNREAYMQQLMALIPRIEQETGIKITHDVSKEKITAYTTVGGAPHLDNEYTVFGKVIQGLDVLDKIAAVDTDTRNRPLKDVRFSVSVEELSRRKISKKYGYQYPEKE